MQLAVRIAALSVVVTGIVVAVIYRDALDPFALRSAISASPLSPVVFIALQIMASLFFVPRTVLGVAAGLVFGLAWGAVWAIIGALAGAAVGFIFVRWMGGTGVLDTTPGLGKLVAKVEHGGWRAVAIVRLMPLPHSVVNTALAATNVGWRDFLVGSFFGMLPMTLAQVHIGASGGEILLGDGRWAVASLLLAAGLGASFFLNRVASRWR